MGVKQFTYFKSWNRSITETRFGDQVKEWLVRYVRLRLKVAILKVASLESWKFEKLKGIL